MNLNVEDFKKIGIPAILPYMDGINKYFKLGKINTINRILCLMANLLHESGDFRFLEEIESGVAYEGRKDLGNIQKGDGVRYKGRSAIMITGRSNYAALTQWYQKKGGKDDFVKNPKLLATNQYAILPAIWFWEANNLEAWADKGDFRNVSSIINTGRVQDPNKPHTINGWEDRLKKYAVVEAWLKKIINNG